MVFSSTEFLFLFLPIVLIVYYNPFNQNLQFKNGLLFLFSIGFYAFGEPIFIFLMLSSIIVSWKIALKMDSGERNQIRKFWLRIGTLYHIFILFVFKYLAFITQQLGLLIHWDITIQISLPIGISFFTFQLMSYLFDVYYQDVPAQKNALYVGLYVSFFPQLIAGPIVRYQDIAYEIENRVETIGDFMQGMTRFIYGLGKKLLIANYVAVIDDNVFMLADAYPISVLTAWMGILAYSMQIYFDFSGYSDMAIGLGQMFGFHFLENFNYPYVSKSVTEFWRRWHMSLSTWFRDYVYIPLGGSRVGKVKWIRNLLIVWTLTGIWHGANWTFVVWGLYYFLLLLIERLTGLDRKLGVLSRFYTAIAVLVGWVFFRSESLGKALDYLARLFGFGAAQLVDEIFYNYMANGALMILIAFILSMPLYPKLMAYLREYHTRCSELVESFLILIVFVLSILVAISSTYNPFIYFNF